MKVQFTARHFKPTDELRSYAINSVERLERIEDGIMHAEVILTEEQKPARTMCQSEIKLKVFDTVITTKASGAKHVTVIDSASKKIERLLEKQKEKRQRERLRKSKQASTRS